VAEIIVGRQDRQTVPQAELRIERVDCLDLDAFPPAGGTEVGGSYMYGPIGKEQRERREGSENPGPGSGALESLEQLLQDEASREHILSGVERPVEKDDFRDGGGPVAP
jgi:hypothetical protein